MSGWISVSDRLPEEEEPVIAYVSDQVALQDAIGDVIVCLVNLSVMSGLDINECCESAWDEIKDRKGRMVAGGAFVKE